MSSDTVFESIKNVLVNVVHDSKTREQVESEIHRILAGDNKAQIEANFKSIKVVLDKFVLDKDRGQAESEINQILANKVEATHPSVFVAGWRPLIGWACCASIALVYVVKPIAAIVLASINAPNEFALMQQVKLEEALWPLVVGTLGFGGLRSFEKVKKVARNDWEKSTVSKS